MNITSGDRRWPRRLAVLPAAVIGLAVAGAALSPTAHAAGNGTWATPGAGSTVSGTAVALQFTTSDTTVTFVLPYGSETATVSGGVATGTFDSTRVSNGTATLGATECNVVNMCDTVDETVTVGNQTATTAAPQATFAPAGGTVAPGSMIAVGSSGVVSLTAVVDHENTVFAGTQTSLPYSYQVPTDLAVGSHDLQLSASYYGMPPSTADYTVVVPDITPPVISNLRYPTRYFPVRDGYLDHFFAEFTTNENSTAVLSMFKSGKVVSSGTVPITNSNEVDLRAGDKLKPGTYQWQLQVTDTAGNVATTPMHSVVADTRRTVGHTATLTVDAASLAFKNLSGSCSSVKKSGTSVVLASLSRCSSGTDENFDIAAANFFPVVKNAVDYGGVTLKIVSHGVGLVVPLNFATRKFGTVVKLKDGTTTLKLSGDSYVGYPKPELIVEIFTAAGKKVTVASMSATYTYKTLSKK